VSQREGIDWNNLRYFLAAARAGSLTGAARALGVEHSTVGRRLTTLESALGAPLLTRSPDGLALTSIGAQIVALAEEMERAALAVHQVVTSHQTQVRLATPSVFSRILAPHIGAFHAAHPHVTIEILSGSRVADLKRSEADLAIRSGTIVDDDLVVKKLGELGWSLYASDAYLARRPGPSDPHELRGHDLVGFEASVSGMGGAAWLERYSEGAHIAMRCREVSDVMAACLAGLGLAVLPCAFAELEPSLRRLTPEHLASSHLSLVCRKEAQLTAPVKAVFRFIADVMQTLLGHKPAGAKGSRKQL
jgi:DNA-binding transcriptional LysR family regulator